MSDMDLSTDGGDTGDAGDGGFDPQVAMNSLYGPAGSRDGSPDQNAGPPSDGESVTINVGTHEADAEVVSTFGQAATELGIPGEKAQALFDKLAPAVNARQEAALSQAKQELANQAGAEFGEELPTVVKNAQHTLRAAGKSGRDLANLLDESGMGSHPVVLRFLSDLRDQVV